MRRNQVIISIFDYSMRWGGPIACIAFGISTLWLSIYAFVFAFLGFILGFIAGGFTGLSAGIMTGIFFFPPRHPTRYKIFVAADFGLTFALSMAFMTYLWLFIAPGTFIAHINDSDPSARLALARFFVTVPSIISGLLAIYASQKFAKRYIAQFEEDESDILGDALKPDGSIDFDLLKTQGKAMTLDEFGAENNISDEP